jgi:DNA polymerase-3 subunit delta'
MKKIPAISRPLPWHGEIWARLGRQLDQGRLSHAFLLSGRRYTGKSCLALALARLLLCHQPVGGLNCGRCRACEFSAAGSHGDFLWLAPQEKSRVIKVDQVREVIDLVSKTAGFGQRRVVVLNPAEAMNTSSANALLKSLEEPAADTHLLLLTQRLHGLPATIRSRCQIVKLPVPDRQQGLAWLEQMTGEQRQSEQMLDLAGGLPMLAAQLGGEGAEQAVARRRALLGLFAGECMVSEVADLLAELSAEEFLDMLESAMQEALRSVDRRGLMSGAARDAFTLLDQLSSLRKSVHNGANPNRPLLAESLLVRAQRLLGRAPLGDNIRRKTGAISHD